MLSLEFQDRQTSNFVLELNPVFKLWPAKPTGFWVLVARFVHEAKPGTVPYSIVKRPY